MVVGAVAIRVVIVVIAVGTPLVSPFLHCVLFTHVIISLQKVNF